MTEIIEIIYAYLLKEGVHGTLSGTTEATYQRNCTDEELVLAKKMIGSAGFLGLSEVDRTRGVSPNSGTPYPDYNLRSIAYLPFKDGGKAMLRVNTLRNSLKDYDTRGNKELSDGLIFDEPPVGFYVVDMFDQRFTEDIPLTPDSSPDNKNSSEMKVIGDDGERTLAPRSFKDMASSFISKMGLIDLDISIVAGLLSKIVEAKKAGNTLFLIYEPNQVRTIESYLRCAMKFMPPKLANGFSFITCYGGDPWAARDIDICGIPTTDDRYVKNLKGIAYRPLQEMPELGVYSVIEDMENNDILDDWAEVLRKENAITDIEGLETALSMMTWGDEDDAYARVVKALKLITDNYKELSRLFDDPIEKLGLRQDLMTTIGILDTLDLNEYYGDIVQPLARIVEKNPWTDDGIDLSEQLLQSVIGLGNPDKDAIHHRFVDDRWDDISKWIGSNIGVAQKMVIDYSGDIGDFLDSFFASIEYGERALNIARSFLEYLLRMDTECIERMDILFELMIDRDQFVDVIKTAFDIDCEWNRKMTCITGLLKKEYSLVEQQEIDVRVWEGMFEKFIAEVRNRGKMDEAASYYSATVKETDEFMMMLTKKVMVSYIEALTKYSKLKDICTSFQRTSMFSEKMTQFKNKATFYAIYLEKMSPEYAGVIDGSNVREMRAVADDIEKIVRKLGDTRFASYNLPNWSDFLGRLNDLLIKVRNAPDVTDVENRLSASRVEFVLNEVELLGAVASNRLIRHYCGVTIHRQSDAREIVEKFLKGDGDPETKRSFCMEVFAERMRVKNSYVIKDYALRFVYALIFAVCMSALVFIGGYEANQYFSNGYLTSVYYVATVITFFVSLALFIDSYRLKGTHNVVFRALIQTLVLIAVAFSIYILIQQLLLNMLN